MCKRIWFALLAVVVVFFAGCRAPLVKDYNRPLPEGEFALRKITDPAALPDFTIACCELTNLKETIDKSLNYLNKPSSRNFFPCGEITHHRAAASLKAFRDLLDSGLVGRELTVTLQEKFDVYTSVGCDDRGTVLFTGYYTPIFDGSLERTEKFGYPLYKQPADLVKTEDGRVLGRQTGPGQISPYSTRTELEKSGELKGLEIAWLSDAFEVYVAHVQGSAKIRLADGKLVTLGYAASNGHEYKSVAQELVADGRIPAAKMSLKAMIEYFRANPGEVEQYISRNPRFVFFQLSEGQPRGSLNEEVTPMRTIATDKAIYPRGCLAFMSTRFPRAIGTDIANSFYTGFALDQDTGGAIRAPGRCDVYMGQGEQAGLMAGQIYQEGRLYYLFLKPEYLGRQD